ncbi:MAG: DUF1015 family protein [Planctomycetota bacterium]
MVAVRPFRGLRSRPALAGEVACPPYDVLSTEEAREMAKGKPNSFLRVDKAEIEFEPGVDPYSDRVYAKARENLDALIRAGVMLRDPEPCYYLYRLTWRGRSQTGLIALTSVDEYDAGRIKKHEHTRPEKVRDRANHIEKVQAQVGLVFSAFRQRAAIAQLFGKVTALAPATAFATADSVRHELWVVRDQATKEAIGEAFAATDPLYIADGHHRSQAASEVCRRFRERTPNFTGEEPENFFINVLFPHDELRILAYNRVVRDGCGLGLDQILERAAEKFDVRPSSGAVEPARAHQFGLYAEQRWFVLEARPGTFDPAHPTQSIDAAILARNLLEPVFGITDPKTDKRIDFVGGIRGTHELVRAVDSGKFKIAFSLHPTSIEQLFKVADSGEVMPPKSTWFEPKLLSGVVAHVLSG